MTWLLSVWFACAPAPASTWRACPPDTGPSREACLARTLPDRFCEDPADAAAMVDREIRDHATRDLLWLTVVNEVAPRAEWCARIRDPGVAAHCQDVLARPHLRRGTMTRCGAAR
ncbi:MAG: hypothetical protein RLZZ299_2531 [Pseudomonadota bacterium]